MNTRLRPSWFLGLVCMAALAGTAIAAVGDTDGDGVPDFIDRDSDGDNIPDAIEGHGDWDKDGIPNNLDTDDDNDGIPTGWELLGDFDGDGQANYLDSDSDNDGLTDGVEGTGDVDQDGIANYLDVDTDGDGIRDGDEGTGDSDQDGIADYIDVEANGENTETLSMTVNSVLGQGCKDDQDCKSGKCESNSCVCSESDDCPSTPDNAMPFCVKAAFRRNECILRCETDNDCPADRPSCGTKLGTRYRRCR